MSSGRSQRIGSFSSGLSVSRSSACQELTSHETVLRLYTCLDEPGILTRLSVYSSSVQSKRRKDGRLHLSTAALAGEDNDVAFVDQKGSVFEDGLPLRVAA